MVFLMNLLKKIPPVPTVLFLLNDSAPCPSDSRLYLEVALLMSVFSFLVSFVVGWNLESIRIWLQQCLQQ
jgi:hypothetical protein